MTVLAWIFLITTIFSVWTGLAFSRVASLMFTTHIRWYDKIIIFPAKFILWLALVLKNAYNKKKP